MASKHPALLNFSSYLASHLITVFLLSLPQGPQLLECKGFALFPADPSRPPIREDPEGL